MGLTPHHDRVLRYVAAGMMNKQIAHELGVTQATVEFHLHRIKRRLKYNTRGELILMLNGIDPAVKLAQARELGQQAVKQAVKPCKPQKIRYGDYVVTSEIPDI